MRTILAFVLTAAVFAQVPGRPPDSAIARLEKKVTDSTATNQDRLQLITLYEVAGDFDAHRRQAFWMIENRPEAPEVRSPQMMFVALAPAMRETAAMASDLWRAQAAKPGASPKTIANAAWFLRLRDRKFAWDIVDAGLRDHPGDPDLERTRGLLDVLAISGATFDPFLSGTTDPALRNSPEAKRASREIEDSHEAPLLIGASDAVLQQLGQLNDAPAFHDEDPLVAAERWAARAREIAPTYAETPILQSRIFERRASQAVDPLWKVELYRKADALDPNFNLVQLATAEFEAGDDDGAVREAHRALDRKNPNPNAVHRAHTVLGRVALARGDVATAKAELLASIATGPGNYNMQPDRSLAQDLLDHGERDAVVEFLERFRRIWINDEGALDYYIRLAKSPGHPDLTASYRAGMNVRSRPVQLPETLQGKFVLLSFRKADCRNCDSVDAWVRQIGTEHSDLMIKTIDASDKDPLALYLEVQTFPTVALIAPTGIVREYLVGNILEKPIREAVNRDLQPGATPSRLAAPKPLSNEVATKLEWSRVEGAQSYIVQLDQRDAKGWRSDRDDKLVRVIPSADTSVTLDPSLGETAAPAIRWRVFAVSQAGPGAVSDWREVRLERP